MARAGGGNGIAAETREALARLREFNPYHDEAGRFSTKDGARTISGGGMSTAKIVNASMAEIAPHVDAAWKTKAGTDLVGLPTGVGVGGGARMQSHALAKAQEVARGYMKEAGLDYNPPTEYVKVDPERARRIAAAYDDMKHAPRDPQVLAAYKAMADETVAQYDYIVKHAGLVCEFMPPDGDAYGSSPRKAQADVVLNNHMYIFSTADGFGSSADFDPSDNPLLADSGRKFGGKTALVNDIFRAVHDYFGHHKEGNGFRADGEENAWRVHSAMYSKMARWAMTSETRGQNSWVNFGPHAEFNRTANGMDTIYADQKAGLLPEWVMIEGSGRIKEARVSSREEDEGRPGNRFARIRLDAQDAVPLQEFNPYHDDVGRFTTAAVGRTIVTSNVRTAARALAEGRKVRLRSVREVSTFLDELATIAVEAAKAGEQAPDYDLCKVSVKGTNLFCTHSKNIERIHMPQLAGQPRPGSRAAKLERAPNGEVDVAEAFRRHLKSQGVGVDRTHEKASYLKASQIQLIGTKVGGMWRAAQAGTFNPAGKSIFVSRDNYVVDGHHRWAATVGLDTGDGRLGDLTMPVERVDMDIIELLALANKFTTDFGILPKAAAVKEARRVLEAAPRLRLW